MGKNPAFLFYPNDWTRDLEEYPLEIEGAWIRICCKLWWSETPGILTKSLEQWAKILRENKKKTQKILNFLATNGIADLLNQKDNQNNGIQITSRRMVRDEYIRKIRAEAGSKGGNPTLRKGQKNPYYDTDLLNQKDKPPLNQRDKQKITPSVSVPVSSSVSVPNNTKNLKTKTTTTPLTPQGEDVVVGQDRYFNFSPEDFKDLWNLSLGSNGFAKCQSLDVKENNRANTKTRRQLIEALLKQRQCPGYWHHIFSKVAASPFMQGENEKKWKASIDFVIRSGSHIKILEGKYDDRSGWDKESWDFWFSKRK